MKLIYLIQAAGWLHLSCAAASAQRVQASKATDNLSATVSARLGVTQLYGDLGEPRSAWVAGAQFSLPLTPTVAVDFSVDKGRLVAQQEDFYNSRAETVFWQIAVGGQVNLLRLFIHEPLRSSFTAYGGIGLLFFDAHAYHLVTGQQQRFSNDHTSYHTRRDGVTPKGKQGVSYTRELCVPIGLRFSKLLGPQLSAFGDVRLNLVQTDKLDATIDPSTGSPASDIYGNPPDHHNRDKWGSLTVGFTYHFGR